MDIILGIALVLAGGYITYLHSKLSTYRFSMALFAAFWDATEEHVESLGNILDVAKDLHVDIAIADQEYGNQHLVNHSDMLCLSLEERIDHMQAIMNGEEGVELNYD